jgi:hypothetical protein
MDAFFKSLDADKSEFRMLEEIMRVQKKMAKVREHKVNEAHQRVSDMVLELKEMNAREDKFK